MIQKIKAADRFHIESDWLSAYWLFSFDRYYDPENMKLWPFARIQSRYSPAGRGLPDASPS